MRTKLVACLLAVCMTLQLLPVAVFAVNVEEIEAETDSVYNVYIYITGPGRVQTQNAESDEWEDAACVLDVNADTCAIVKVTADDGNKVASIYANGEALTVGGEGLVEIPVGTSDVVVDVAFIDENAECYNINPEISIENILGLTISAEDYMAFVGDTVYVSAEADPGYVITEAAAIPQMPEISVEVSYDEISGKWKFTMPDCDVDVTATAKQLHQITVETVGEDGKLLADGEGGTVNVSPLCSRAEGQGVDISVFPNPDCDIKTVTASGVDVTHDSTDSNGASYYGFTMPDEDVTLTVVFEKKSYEVNWTDPAGGSITVAGIDDDKKALPGKKITVTVVLESGYTLKGVDVVDEEGNTSAAAESSAGVYTFNMPASNVTVAADIVLSDVEIGEETKGETTKDPEDTVPDNPYSGPVTSPVTIEKSKNGRVEVNPVRAEANKEVTVTVTPDEGFVVDEIKVFGKDGKPLEVTESEDNKSTFKMPGGGATVTATFKKDDGGDFPAVDIFTDVEESDWFADAVEYAYDNGLMIGTGDNTFSPGCTMSRSEAAMIIYRMNGSPSVAGLENKFPDVSPGEWYTDAVLWCSANGKMLGCDDGRFGVSDAVTREQIALIFMRQMDGSDVCGLYGFNDADEVDGWALDAMRWAVAAGIIEGNGSGLDPLGDTTRAAMAQILMNAKAAVGEAPSPQE